MGEEGERMRTLKLGFKEAVSKTAQIVEDPQKLKRFLKDNPELCNKAVELARSLRENADAKFKELCQKYDVEAQLNKLDELLSMPWNEHLHKGDDESVDACNPSALDTDRYIVDVHKVIEENIKSDLIFEQYQQLQKELESMERERDLLAEKAQKNAAEKSQLRSEINQLIKELTETLNAVQKELELWNNTQTCRFVENVAQ